MNYSQSRPFTAPAHSSSYHQQSSTAHPLSASSFPKPAPPSPSPPSLAALEDAAKVVQDHLHKDATRIPELGETLTASASSTYTELPHHGWAPFHLGKTIRVPEALFEHMDQIKSQVAMGILPEVERAWIAINHKLFLWDYAVEGSEFIRYEEEQMHLISHVAVVKPKPGIFIDEITSLLVLSTPAEIVILGLSVNGSDLKLYATDMSIKTEGIEMTSVVGTDKGRIFMCGVQDGCVYELAYQAAEGWFSKKIKLINHSIGTYGSLLPSFASKPNDLVARIVIDKHRNCLYTRSTNDHLSVIYLGSAGDLFTPITTLTSICKSAQVLCPGTPSLDIRNFSIAHLQPTLPNESKNVHLVAITSTGCRLYFTHSRMGYNGYSYSSSRSGEPSGLHLMHVRPPPASLRDPLEEESARHAARFNSFAHAQQMALIAPKPLIITEVPTAFYASGFMVSALSSGQANASDTLLCTSIDLGKISASPPSQAGVSPNPSYNNVSNYGSNAYGNNPPRHALVEFASLLPVTGKAWAVAEIPRPSLPRHPPALPHPNALNELASQFSEPLHTLLLLTNQGLTKVVKQRPVDCLKELLNAEDAVGQVSKFIENYGRDQTCAMLLALACGSMEGTGGTPEHHAMTSVPPEVASAAKSFFYDIAGKPVLNERAGGYGVASGQTHIIFSGRREGLAIYFARLVQPIWLARVTTGGLKDKQVSNIPDSTLVGIQNDLSALRNFLLMNPQLFNAGPAEFGYRQPNDLDPWKMEEASAADLTGLVGQTIEAISFILLLIDYKLSEVIAQCEPAVQQITAELTYQDLVATKKGRDVARGLVNAVINHQISQQISVDTISEILQQRCGSFCSADDVLQYKAIENVRRAKETRDVAERQQCLTESLRLFSKGMRKMELSKLKEVAGEYRELRYPNGAIELPLRWAIEWDADNQAHDYFLSGSAPSDARQSLYVTLTQCYDLVLEALSAFDALVEKARGVSGDAVVVDDSEIIQANAYQLALSSEDAVFHSYLYDWLIDRGMTDQLLETRSPFLEAHLSRAPVTLEKIQLLWQFYVKNGQFLRAAQTLATLAESTEFGLTLETRIEYLTLAVGNAKSHSGSDFARHESAVEFLTDLEEKVEVAQVQLEILGMLKDRKNVSEEDRVKIDWLVTDLLNISQLFKDFADYYELHTMKLLILHVSEHRDPYLVSSTWEAIFAEAKSYRVREPEDQAKTVARVVAALGQRFYPSEIAFPLDIVAALLESYTFENRNLVSSGWAPRVLVDASVPYGAVFDIFRQMYESQVPPFNTQQHVQWVSSDIAVLLSDWLDEVIRPHSSIPRREFPANVVDESVDQYLRELVAAQDDTKRLYKEIKVKLRQHF